MPEHPGIEHPKSACGQHGTSLQVTRCGVGAMKDGRCCTREHWPKSCSRTCCDIYGIDIRIEDIDGNKIGVYFALPAAGTSSAATQRKRILPPIGIWAARSSWESTTTPITG